MTTTEPTMSADASEDLPRWSVADVHESLQARTFTDEMERAGAEISRLQAMFEAGDIRETPPRAATSADGQLADQVINAYNETVACLEILEVVVYTTVATDSREERAQSLLSELSALEAKITPLLARLADWVKALGVEELAEFSPVVAEHLGPLRRLRERAERQMSELEEGLYAELATTASSAWGNLQRDVTSQLQTQVRYPDGQLVELPMPAVRGLATHADPEVRRAAYDAELSAWPSIATPVAAALNAIKGEAVTVNQRRGWSSPLDASLFANSVSRPTFEAMQSAVVSSLPDFRRWMRTKAALHGDRGPLKWWDLVAPLPGATSEISWDTGLDIVRDAFRSYSPSLAGLVDRALDEKWIDAGPRPGKSGGAFCMPFVGDRSLVLLNWSGSAESAQTTAHELGHAFHNTTLVGRTPLQKRLPMALAETASIFCETLVVEEGLSRLVGSERLSLLNVDLQGANQVVVDINSRWLFETEVFARRQRRTLGITELNEIMLEAQSAAYGDGLDQSTAHRYMWLLKSHYYGSHFYNWPYTYGLLFGLGLFAKFTEDPERFGASYEDLLSRAGMDTAEELGLAFGLDVTDEAFWTASLDVLRVRMAEFERLATAPEIHR